MFEKGNTFGKGRPKKKDSLTEILRIAGDEPCTPEGQTRKQELSRILWVKAMEGDMPAIKYIYDRVDGLPIAKQEISGEDGEPVQVRVVFDK